MPSSHVADVHLYMGCTIQWLLLEVYAAWSASACCMKQHVHVLSMVLAVLLILVSIHAIVCQVQSSL